MTMKKSRVALAVAQACGAIALATVSQVGWAQESKMERVEVTGSSIKRVAAEASLPVQTFSQADIQKSGATSVTDFIQNLPAMQGFTSTADSVGGGGGGVTTASIHDVGEQYTLVLLNGRRVAPATSGTTIDLNSIPLAAIERVEVLTDGASALYGADAIAGVVNFILKKGEQPFQVEFRSAMPQHKGAGSGNFSMSKGWGNLEKDGYSLFAALSLDRNDELRALDRNMSKTGIINVPSASPDAIFFNGSSRSVPPNVDVRYLNPSAANPNRISTTSFSPYAEANGKCPPQHLYDLTNLGRQCWFDYASSVLISPQIERTGAYVTGEMKLGNSGFKAFADVAYTDVSTLARIAPYPAEFSLLTSSPLYATYVLPYLTAAQAANVQSVNVKYRLYDMANRTYDYNTKSTHMVAGIDGTAGAWDINGAITHSVQDQDQNWVDGFPLADKFLAAVNAGTINPFPYAKGEMPAAMVAALKATGFSGNYNNTEIAMDGADLRGSRDLFQMAGGASRIGMGVDYRKTGYKVTANPAVANAEILFDDVQTEYDLSRNNWGAYTEVVFPITKQIELSGALRYDSIGGVDNSMAGQKFGDTQTQTTYKFSGRYQPTKSMVVRGSYGTGFRAGSMLEIAQPQADFGVTSGTYDCPFNGSYDPLGYFAKGYVCDDKLQKEVFTSGNPDLKPETSKQWTIGTVFEPMDGLSVALDYWTVNVDDAVTSVDEALILADPVKYLDLYTTKFKSSNGLTYVAINLAPINIGKVENTGFDWDFTYKFKTGLGKATAKIAGTHLIKSRYTTPGTDDSWETSLGEFGSNNAVSFKNVVTAQGSLESGDLTNTLTMKYRSGYKDKAWTYDDCIVFDSLDCYAVQLKVPAYYTFDWQSVWKMNKSVTLTLGVNNVADKEPPRSLRTAGGGHQLGYDPRYADIIGRVYYLQGSLKF